MEDKEGLIVVPSLERATHAVGLLLERRLGDLGITQAEAHVLAYLSHAGDRSINDIHASFGHRRSTLTAILDRLERRAMVRRGPHPTSRRLVMVHLTDAGRTAGNRVVAVLRDLEDMVTRRAHGGDVDAFARVTAAIEEVAHD